MTCAAKHQFQRSHMNGDVPREARPPATQLRRAIYQGNATQGSLMLKAAFALHEYALPGGHFHIPMAWLKTAPATTSLVEVLEVLMSSLSTRMYPIARDSARRRDHGHAEKIRNGDP